MDECLLKLVNNCLLEKLSKDYHASDTHVEYQVRNNKLKTNMNELISLLDSEEFMKNFKIKSSTLSHVLILYLELQSEGPWNNEISVTEYASNLNKLFIKNYTLDLDEVVRCNHIEYQLIFDTCVMELHKKMTVEDFRRYPSLIEVYCMLVKNVKGITLNPVTVLPVCLLLIEDYVTTNKIKGLQSCRVILQHLTTEAFTAGNYYEVVYSSLKKNIVEKDRDVTQTLFNCFIEFLKIIPLDNKKNKLDDIFSNVVDQLHTESNLYRKADCFNFISKIIEMHGIHCVKKKIFKDIICDNIDVCCQESVSEILLLHVLECLQTWIRHCWCVWKYSTDHKMLSSLLKILYLNKEEDTKSKIQNLILTLLSLCSKDEQSDILLNLQKPLKCSKEDFINRLQYISSTLA